MNIAIDLDDVTVAIMNGLTAYNNKFYKATFSVNDHIVFGLEKIWQCTPEEAMRRVYEFYHSEYMDTLLPMEGADRAIKKLLKKHSLSFITSRPVFTEEKTKAWLKKYLGTESIPVYFTNQYSPDGTKKLKKSTICKQISAELIIEDSPENIMDCASENIRVLVFDRPWNQDIKDSTFIQRVKDWKKVLDIVNS